MKSTTVFLAIFGILWTGLVGVMDTVFLKRLFQQTMSAGYPSVEGRITHAELTSHRGSKGGYTYGVKIAYRYEVQGKSFESDRFRFLEGSSSDSAWAHRALAKFSLGSTALVYYRPEDPSVSLLEPGVDGSDLVFVLFGLPFNAIALGLLGAGMAGLARLLLGRGDQPEGLRSVLGSGEQRVGLAQWGVLDAGLFGLGCCGFVLTFVVVIGFGGFHPPLPVAAGAISISVCVGVVGAAWQWKRQRSGRFDLVVNRLDGRIELPACHGRKEPVVLATNRVRDVSVEEIVQRTSKGGRSVTYAPTLHLSGPSEQIRIAAWFSSGRARRLANWLKRVLAGES